VLLNAYVSCNKCALLHISFFVVPYTAIVLEMVIFFTISGHIICILKHTCVCLLFTFAFCAANGIITVIVVHTSCMHCFFLLSVCCDVLVHALVVQFVSVWLD